MSKAFAKSLFLLNRALVRRLSRPLVARAQLPPAAKQQHHGLITAAATLHDDALPPADDGGGSDAVAVVCKVEGGLLTSSSAFPYFMLVALEAGAGGLLRALLLLLLYPALPLLGQGRGIKAMAVVSFLGLRKDAFRAGRAALPKLFMEDVSAEVFETAVAATSCRRRRRRCVCVSAMPKVMVEPFLREYLGVDDVVAPEMREFMGYYMGVMEEEGDEVLQGLNVEEVIASEKAGGDDVVGIGGLGEGSFDNLLQKNRKEVELARRQWHSLPRRRRHPKPLIFHDGRTAFRPTPAATLAMFMWLPLGAVLAVVRTAAFLLLPFSLSVPFLAAVGMHSRAIYNSSSSSVGTTTNLYACNHRSLLDPLYIAAGAGRADLAAATYSISRLSEALSPIPTFRLTRDRAADRAAMQARLSRGGGLVVCPEGTTCREPFLLRFSPLFAELGRDVTPVALHSAAGMFHGTTAGGWKALDPLFLLMNPVPAYIVQFLDPVPVAVECGGGGDGPEAARAVANEVQRRIAEALGYTCTELTRKDKYLMLAGNEGLVGVDQGAKKHTTLEY